MSSDTQPLVLTPSAFGHEQTLTESFRLELRNFDRERVLSAWDSLVTKQQAALEGWGTPTMFPTSHGPDREVSTVRNPACDIRLSLDPGPCSGFWTPYAHR